MKILLILLIGVLGLGICNGQNVPLGSWETHYSYSSARQVLDTKTRIFCATYNGLFSIDPVGKNFRIYSKSDGLSDVGVSSMGYNADEKMMLLAYRSGNIDFLYLDDAAEPAQIVKFSALRDAAELPQNKQINKVVFHDKLAYLGTGFGIVVLDSRTSEVVEVYRYIGNNGTEVAVKDLTFTKDSLFAATSQGLLGTSLSPTVNRQYFANWKTVLAPATPLSVIARDNILYAGFSGQGIFRRNTQSWTKIYPSTAKNISFSLSGDKMVASLTSEVVVLDQNDKITAYQNPLFISLGGSVHSSTNFLWAADNKNGLISNSDGSFKQYIPVKGDTAIAPKQDSTLTDLNGLVWTRLPAYFGGGISVTNPRNGQQRILSTAPGNGGLPSSMINSLVLDTDGLIWFASEKGAGYFVSDDVPSGARIDAVLPVYGQRKLFSNENCTALAVESGNRKWIGTRTGLYLFSADGSELITHFTNANSPLPVNEIKTLRIDYKTGQLFIDTPAGMVSYQSDSSTPAEDFRQALIFPNPVRPDFSGDLGIKGLSNNCIVKITTLSGRLVYETRSQGGTASWNLRDYNGCRAAGGIYMIMTVSEDKSAKFAGKFVLID